MINDLAGLFEPAIQRPAFCLAVFYMGYLLGRILP